MPATIMEPPSPPPDSTSIPKEHETLYRHSYVWAAVGISQTFLTAIMFGWASLVPILRDEGLTYTPEDLSIIFSCGAVGNYLATLPFGVLLDRAGPKTTGIVASILYALGLALCSFDGQFYCFAIGFGLIGLSRPGIQLPTLHLANLFNQDGGSGGAVYMSCQAAAFDAGTAVFALFHTFYFNFGIPSSTMFLVYLVVPLYSLMTAIFVWPHKTIDKQLTDDMITDTTRTDDDLDDMSLRSPHLTRDDQKTFVMLSERRHSLTPETQRNRSQINAPLSVVLTHVSFYALSLWVGIHIYKLNFIVATINDQLVRHFDDETANDLIDILGAMLPFGFFVLPIVATMLHTQPMIALQVANVVGFIYGAVMVYLPNVYWLQVLIVFPAVATSRQLVYSTLFHSIGHTFGFANYGFLLGLTNAIASLFQFLQTPMVNWSEHDNSYYWSNFILFIVVAPMFVSVLYSDPTWDPSMWFRKTNNQQRADNSGVVNEKSKLLP